MDFFEQQEAARRRTALLVVYFMVAVVLIIAAIYAVAIHVFIYIDGERSGVPLTAGVYWDPKLFVLVAVATLIVIVLGSGYKILALARGGEAVAEALGATIVASDTREPRERQLLNVVAEMAIASGTPVPSVYVLWKESGINAFAAGFSADDAVVAVTRGALETLSRDGLQGVIAHEFSHILNGDMRLNIRLMGILHGILVIGLLGGTIMRSFRYSYSSRRSSGKGAGAIILFGIALFAIGYIGLFFGRLIKAAVSRQREFLADASAVQFTRNPFGLAGALKKIGGLAGNSRLAAPNAEMASHLYFADGLAAGAMSLLATHPPLDERIRRIDPGWDGTFPDVRAGDLEPAPARLDSATAAVSDLSQAGPWGPAAAESRIPITADASVARVGALDPAQMIQAEALIGHLPAAILAAAREPFGARALTYALLIDHDNAVQQNQIDFVQRSADPAVFGEFQKIFATVSGLATGARLPLLTMSLPALRQQSHAQYKEFRENLNQLVIADRRTSSFELVLGCMLRRHLDRHFSGTVPAVAHRQSIERLSRECGILLSVLAHVGQDDPARAAMAFEAGISALGLKPPPPLTQAGATDLSAVSGSLNRLARLKPPHKRRLIAACTATVTRDGKITVEEGEVLRAVSESLEVPMPPFLAAGSDIGSNDRDDAKV